MTIEQIEDFFYDINTIQKITPNLSNKFSVTYDYLRAHIYFYIVGKFK